MVILRELASALLAGGDTFNSGRRIPAWRSLGHPGVSFPPWMVKAAERAARMRQHVGQLDENLGIGLDPR